MNCSRYIRRIDCSKEHRSTPHLFRLPFTYVFNFGMRHRKFIYILSFYWYELVSYSCSKSRLKVLSKSQKDEFSPGPRTCTSSRLSNAATVTSHQTSDGRLAKVYEPNATPRQRPDSPDNVNDLNSFLWLTHIIVYFFISVNLFNCLKIYWFQ